MPRRRDVPCSGGCGQLIWRGNGCLPPGKSMCQGCRRQRRTADAGLRPCAKCGQPYLAPVPISRAKRARKTCSQACRMALVRSSAHTSPGWLAWLERHPGRRRARVCEVCATPYKATYPAQRACGRRCGVVIQSQGRLPATVAIPVPHLAVYCLCVWCGTLGPGRFCSTSCSSLVTKAERRSRPRHCADCATVIEFEKRRCETCVASRRRASRQRLRQRRRARGRGLEHEPYTLEEIAARDQYRCGICRKKVPMDKKVPHRMAPTIDHLIPQSEFGPDTKVNVQLAHFICNSRRGAGGVVQLALVG